MRHLALALVLLLGCSPTEAPARCTPGVQVACACPGGAQGAQACAADGAGYGACACPEADAAVIDAPDAVDAIAPDVRECDPGREGQCTCGSGALGARTCEASARWGFCRCGGTGPDAGSAPDVVDVPAMDVDPRQTPECRAVNQTCDGRRVNVQTGERDAGVTYHCGRCGNTCAVPMDRAAPHVAAFCDGCACVIDCEGDYRDCDGNPANGCEALFGDGNNCGACGRRCLQNQHCTPPPHMCAF